MSFDSSEIVVASDGDVYIADTSITLPTSSETALDDWDLLGYITEDGATLEIGPELVDHNVWQARQAIRREMLEQQILVNFDMVQWNATNVLFAFQGGDIVDLGGGLFRYDFMDESDVLREHALVIDWEDFRLVLPRGNVVEGVETQLQRGALAVLPIGFAVTSALQGDSPAYLLHGGDIVTIPGGGALLGEGLLGEGVLGG